MEKKKTWTEPKLTALVRRKPEEGILQLCKAGSGDVGPEGAYYNCTRLAGCTCACLDWATT